MVLLGMEAHSVFPSATLSMFLSPCGDKMAAPPPSIEVVSFPEKEKGKEQKICQLSLSALPQQCPVTTTLSVTSQVGPAQLGSTPDADQLCGP